MNKNYSFFMKADMSSYIDQWVAVVDRRVIAHGKDAKQVFDEAKRKAPKKRPLIAKIPGKQAMIL
jgi:hypothetical protein